MDQVAAGYDVGASVLDWVRWGQKALQLEELIGGLQHKGIMSTKHVFRENCKGTKVAWPVMWTYDICAFDTGTYYDYYW